MKWENLLLFPLFGFIAWPLAALVPAVGFLMGYSARRRPLILFAGACWLSYMFYEFGMYARVLCSGECNIRVDLLFIYPLLWALSIVALIQLFTKKKPDGAA